MGQWALELAVVGALRVLAANACNMDTVAAGGGGVVLRFESAGSNPAHSPAHRTTGQVGCLPHN